MGSQILSAKKQNLLPLEFVESVSLLHNLLKTNVEPFIRHIGKELKEILVSLKEKAREGGTLNIQGDTETWLISL